MADDKGGENVLTAVQMQEYHELRRDEAMREIRMIVENKRMSGGFGVEQVYMLAIKARNAQAEVHRWNDVERRQIDEEIEAQRGDESG